jgi:hypothetical protein
LESARVPFDQGSLHCAVFIFNGLVFIFEFVRFILDSVFLSGIRIVEFWFSIL